MHSKEGARLVLGAENCCRQLTEQRLIGSGPNSNKLPTSNKFKYVWCQKMQNYNGNALIMEWARIACALQHTTVISYQKSFYDVIL